VRASSEDEPDPVPDPTDPPHPAILISTELIPPLLETTWDQDCGYNTYCPTLSGAPCNHAYTGCTVTAMAQIMKYHNYPNNYNWSLMANGYGTDETARLMGDIFPTVIFSYNLSGSSGYLKDPNNDNGKSVLISLLNDFNYTSATIYGYDQNDPPDFIGNIWHNNIRNGLPMIFGGGHCFSPLNSRTRL